jgi:hypothetical protein
MRRLINDMSAAAVLLGFAWMIGLWGQLLGG